MLKYKVPRIVFYTALRLSIIIAAVFGMLAFVAFLVGIVMLSVEFTDTPLPALGLIMFGLAVFLAYNFAKDDVKDEERRNGKTFDQLSKD